MPCTQFASTNTTDISYTLEETCGTTPAVINSSANNLSVVAATGVVTGTGTSFLTDGITASIFVKITSASDSSQDGIYEVLTAPSNTSFTIPKNAFSADLSEADVVLTGPAFQILPTTGGSPTGNTTTSVSEVIRSDRQTDDLVVTDQEITGSINYELSYAPFQRIMQGLLLDNNIVNINETGQTIAAVAATGVLTGTVTTFITDGWKKGMFFRFSSATDPTEDGIYKIESVDSETQITITANSMSADFSSQTDVVMRAKIVRNGAAAPDNYTVLKRVVNGATTSYFYYNGIQVSQMSFNFTTGSILNGAFDVVGLKETATTIEKTGSVYDNPPAYRLMNSVSSVTAIDLGGASDTLFIKR